MYGTCQGHRFRALLDDLCESLSAAGILLGPGTIRMNNSNNNNNNNYHLVLHQHHNNTSTAGPTTSTTTAALAFHTAPLDTGRTENDDPEEDEEEEEDPEQDSDDDLVIKRQLAHMDPSRASSRASTAMLLPTSASTPSLRSRDGTLPPHMKMDGGGNVKVVVRVRAFLPRGTYTHTHSLSLSLAIMACAASYLCISTTGYV
jgi:hypothetical protein